MNVSMGSSPGVGGAIRGLGGAALRTCPRGIELIRSADPSSDGDESTVWTFPVIVELPTVYIDFSLFGLRGA